MSNRILLALTASSILVTGLPCRAVAQINGSQAADYEQFKRAILAGGYAYDPRITPFFSRKPLQSNERQANPDANATANAGEFVTFDAPGAGTGAFQGTLAFAINPVGTITGWYVDASNVSHGFVRAGDGRITTIDPPGSVSTHVWSINPAGAITGDYYDTTARHGFLRTADGAVTTFDAPDAGTLFYAGTWPTGINPDGTITGLYFDANFVFHGFLRDSDGVITTFDAPGAVIGTSALSINPRGTVAGCYVDANFVGHGLVRTSDGALTTFDVPNSTNLSCFPDYGILFFPSPVGGINPAGAMTGSYFEPISGSPFGGNYRGFLRAPDGTFTRFDAVPSPSSPCCTWTFGIAINPAGEVAGWDNDYNGVNHGFVRANDGTVTILDAPGAGMAVSGGTQGTLAQSINPGGQVAGFYYDANSAYHGFLWKKQ